MDSAEQTLQGTGVNPFGGDPNTGNFVPGGFASPFFDRVNMGNALASFGGAAIPGAAAFQSEAFNPGFSPMENAFMESESARQSRMLGPMLASLEHQYGGTPFHSGIGESVRQMGEGMALNLGNQATQLGLNRQNNAFGQLGRILGSPMENLTQAQAGMADLGGFTQNLMNSYFQVPMSVAQGSTFIPSSIIASPGGGSSGGK